MRTRLDEIIEKLDDCHEDDIKISSQIFGLAAASLQKNQELLGQLQESYQESSDSKLLPPESQKITQSYLEKRYGNYQKAYQAYRDCYGIKCKRGWKYLLEKIQGLAPPQTSEQPSKSLEERVASLEKTVAILVELITSGTEKK